MAPSGLEGNFKVIFRFIRSSSFIVVAEILQNTFPLNLLVGVGNCPAIWQAKERWQKTINSYFDRGFAQMFQASVCPNSHLEQCLLFTNAVNFGS